MPAASLATLLISASLSAFGLPLGLPPAAEDPQMARIAPAQCAAYVSWAATAEPKAGSGNSFEQFLLDKEVGRSGAELQRVFGKLMQIALSKAPEADQALIRDILVFYRGLLGQPGALFLQLKARPGSKDPDFGFALVLRVGGQTETGRKLLDQLIRKETQRIDKIEIGGQPFYRGLATPTMPVVGGFYDDCLIYCSGEGVAEGVIERWKQAPPQWLVDAQKRMTLPRRSSLAVIHLKEILAHFPMEESNAQTLRDLGFDRITSVESVTGLDASGVVSRTVLRSEAPHGGIFKLLESPGIAIDDFKTLPRNTLTSYAVRFDAPAIFDFIAKAARPAGDDINKALELFKEQVGLDLRRELLPALGNKIRAWSAPQAFPTGAPSSLFSLDIKDRAVIEKFVERVVEKISEQQPQLTIAKEKVGGVQTYTLQTQGLAGAATFAWAVLPDRFVFTTRPRLLREQIEQPADFESVAASPELAAAIKANPRASLVVFEDTAKIYKLIYNLIGIGIPFAAQMAPEWTADLSLDLLPDPESVGKVLKPSITTIGMTAEGLEVESRTSAPMVSASSMTPVMVALLLPAVQAAREAARRAASANNMKMIGIGMHNYLSVHNKFPPAFSTDKDGKPLHSWRVLILPYIDEAALFEKLKLDEPWDSEHNLPILKGARITTYASPADAASSKTRYQTIRLETSVIPGAKSIQPAQIKDGLSNTAMVVETNPAKAVEWYKPDDFVPDEKDAAAGLRGAWNGGFHVGLADGSVRFVSESIDPVMLRRLFERADGKLFDFGDLERDRNGGVRATLPDREATEDSRAPQEK